MDTERAVARQLLTDLVGIPSVSREEAAAVAFLVEWMGRRGFTAWTDEAGNGCGLRGEGPRTLLLLGHIDTVPGWIPVRVEDGVLHGRGSVDAKGSLAAFAAAAALAEPPPGWRVVVIGAVEEEIATSRGARHVRDGFRPDLCIVGEPSGADRITLGYKGRLLVDVTVRRPVRHSARPEPTAAALGAELWPRVAAWAAERNQGKERPFEQIQASLRSFNTHSDGFEERACLRLGFRLPSDCDPETLETVLAPWLRDYEWRAHGAERAYRAPRTSPLARRLRRAIRARGARAEHVLKTGTSDMNVVGVRWSCPIVAYGPGDSSLDHTPDERLSLDELDRAVETLQRLIESLDEQPELPLPPRGAVPLAQPRPDLAHLGQAAVQGALHGGRQPTALARPELPDRQADLAEPLG